MTTKMPLIALLSLLSLNVYGEETDSLAHTPRFIHRIETDGHFAYIFPTHSFLKGYNNQRLIMKYAASYHIKYAFQFQGNNEKDAPYKDTYQGIGFAHYNFDNPEGLGSPNMLYLYQGSPIARFSRRLSFNYEWNFGVSFGWKPYDKQQNPMNKLIGSKVNAYLNANFYLNWKMARQFDLNVGIEGTHFSNGNTKYPNLGLNTAGIKAGFVYYFDQRKWLAPSLPTQPEEKAATSPAPFKDRISYDVTLFGSWRRTGVNYTNGVYLAPKAYPVVGFSFNPMYRFNPYFKGGISLDGVYDGGSQIKGVEKDVPVPLEEESDMGFDIVKPPFHKQLSLGLAARAEFVMPYFSINFGVGGNILNSNEDLKFFYQSLTLKVNLVKDLYLNIGYNLRNFQEPNYLMLGFGYRFHNKK